MITLNNVSKSYGDNKVLEGVNLTFERGRIYGLVGENGAGKTTLFRCIAGLETYQGKIVCDRPPMKNHLGFLMTDPFLFEHMTGSEYIHMLCHARGVKNINVKVNNIFELPLERYAMTYSTGMKKKLALTALLLQGNDYIILDEPYNGVDIQSNLVLTELILKLKSLDKVVIVSSHIFSTLEEMCDQIIYLQKGAPLSVVHPTDYDNLRVQMKQKVISDALDRITIQ